MLIRRNCLHRMRRLRQVGLRWNVAMLGMLWT